MKLKVSQEGRTFAPINLNKKKRRRKDIELTVSTEKMSDYLIRCVLLVYFKWWEEKPNWN